MKKIKYLFLCLAAVVLVACLTGCSSRENNQTTQQSQSTTGGTTCAGTGTAATESGSGTAAQDTSSYRSDNEMNEGAGAGSTGSTEGETGVLDGLMQDAEDGMGDWLDDGVNSSTDGRGFE